MTGLTLTKDCPKCGQPSTVLFSLGYCGHCGYKPPADPAPKPEDP